MGYEAKYEDGLLTITHPKVSPEALFKNFLFFLNSKLNGMEVIGNQFIGTKKTYYYEISMGVWKSASDSPKFYSKNILCVRKSLIAPRGKRLDNILSEYADRFE